MKVPFQLRRVEPAPAVAFLLESDAEALLRLVARQGRPGFPTVHAVAGGFLIRLAAPESSSPAGVTRLRALSANLFLPVDAELSPALLPDEAQALVRHRGLVFLPGGRVLAFDPEATLGPAQLLRLERRESNDWQPVPAVPERPLLHEVHLDLPPTSLDEILAASGQSIGTEPLAGAGPAGQGAVRRGQAAVGQWLHWLGQKMNWSGLVDMGQKLASKASRPGPDPEVQKRQEEALRKLLQRFKDGDTNEALRRALPLHGAGGRGGEIDTASDLGERDLRYDRNEFLTTDTRPGRVWLGSEELYAQLQAAYRQAADEACRKGDFVRAAVIHGKLLGDWRQAAGLLARAGLHHDAALVYLEKLKDPLSAARQFESAGEFDRALALYRQRGEHLLAGDLLRRTGEHEQALQEYLTAAQLEASHGRYTAAARLLLERAGRPDLAEQWLRRGWAGRPQADADGCLLRLAELYGNSGEGARLLELLDEADTFFTSPSALHLPGQFYNLVAALARRPALQAVGDELRDRALLGLAAKLRQRGNREGHTVSVLFGLHESWEPALVKDAEVALRGLEKQPVLAEAAFRRQRTHAGELTCACSARMTGELFLGFADGVILHLCPRTGDVTHVPARYGSVTALGCDGRGRFLVAGRRTGESHFLSCFTRTGGTWSVSCAEQPVPCTEGLSQVAGGAVPVVASWYRSYVDYFQGPNLSLEAVLSGMPSLSAVVLMSGESVPEAQRYTVVFAGNEVRAFSVPQRQAVRHAAEAAPMMANCLHLPWTPSRGRWPGLPVLSWLPGENDRLEVAGVGEQGEVGWASLNLFVEEAARVAGHRSSGAVRYLCAAVVGRERVAAVHAGGVDWFRAGRSFEVIERMQADLHDAAACFASLPTRELLVVCHNGELVRIP